MRHALLAAVGVCVLCASLLAQGKFPLKYEDGQGDLQTVLGMAGRGYGTMPQKGPDVKGVPKDLPEGAVYCRLALGEKWFWAAVIGGTSPRLWIDANGNNDLADEKAVEGTVSGSSIEFSPVALALDGKRAVRVRLMTQASGDNPPPYLIMRLAGCFTGEVTLAGKKYRVALIDGSFNGRYDDLVKPPFRRDTDGFAIDLNQDGRLDPPNFSGGDSEWMPLAKAFSVGGVFYRITPAADGSEIQLETFEPAYGNVDLGTKEAEILTFSEFGVCHVKAGEAKVRLPACVYLPVQITLTKTDESGTAWTLRGSPSEAFQQFEVRPDATVEAKLGPPLVLKTSVQQADRQVYIGATLSGQAGEEYTPGAMKGTSRTAPPKLEILDEKQNVIGSGNFEYG